MAMHDWKKIPAGIFHDFHVEWIASIKHSLNKGILPDGYYCLAEQYAGPFGPDVLTLQAADGHATGLPVQRRAAPTLAKPLSKPIAQTEMEFYRSKQRMLTIRHISDDEVVAIIEIVSPGNKGHQARFREFIEKAAWILDQRVQLSIIDLFPPGRRDPNGIHAAIWEAISDEKYVLPSTKKNRTVVSYECGLLVNAYVEHIAVGEKLPVMPLFLESGGCVDVPLEATYRTAFSEIPRRLRQRLFARGE